MCLTLGYVFIRSLVSCLWDSLHLNIHFECKTYELAAIQEKKTLHDLLFRQDSWLNAIQTEASQYCVNSSNRCCRVRHNTYLYSWNIQANETILWWLFQNQKCKRQKKNCHSFRSEGALNAFLLPDQTYFPHTDTDMCQHITPDHQARGVATVGGSRILFCLVSDEAWW